MELKLWLPQELSKLQLIDPTSNSWRSGDAALSSFNAQCEWGVSVNLVVVNSMIIALTDGSSSKSASTRTLGETGPYFSLLFRCCSSTKKCQGFYVENDFQNRTFLVRTNIGEPSLKEQYTSRDLSTSLHRENTPNGDFTDFSIFLSIFTHL